MKPKSSTLLLTENIINRLSVKLAENQEVFFVMILLIVLTQIRLKAARKRLIYLLMLLDGGKHVTWLCYESHLQRTFSNP